MAYAYKRSFTIDHAQCGSSDSNNFAVLIKLDSSNAGITMKTVVNGGHINNTVTQSGGNAVTMPADLVFTSDSGGTTKIPWEIDFYDGTNGILWAWVKLATVSHTSDTVLYVFYDDPTVTTQQNTSTLSPSHVWDSNYIQVVHLPNGTTLSASDSTSNSVNVVTNNATATTGKIDGGASFNGSSSYLGYGTPSATQLTGASTLSIWANFTAFPGSGAVVLYGAFDDHLFPTTFYNNSILYIAGVGIIGNVTNAGTNYGASTSYSTTGSWVYLTWVFVPNTGVFLYVNGVLAASGSAPSVQSSSQSAWTIGAGGNGIEYFYHGLLDEARLSNTNRSADWITTEYNNQNNPESFVTAGSEVTLIIGPFPTHFSS